MDNKKSENLFKRFEKYLNSLNPLSKNNKSTGENDKKTTSDSLDHDGNTWINIENPHRKDLAEFSEKYSFHSLHVEACLSTGELDRVETEEKYMFILLHSPRYDHNDKKIVSDQIGIFLGKDYIITVHNGLCKSLKEAFERCQEDKEFREGFFKKTTSRILFSILTLLEKDISTLLHLIIQELDEIEDLVFDIKISGVYRISQLRQKIIKLRLISLSLREISQTLASSQNSLTVKTTRYFKNVSNDFNKLCENLDEARETVEVYKDADFTVSTERTNKILTVLTIVFTLSIPATVVGAIYGMNILLPGGLDAGSWNFFGEYTTFYVLMVISAISVALMLVYFKYKNWF